MPQLDRPAGVKGLRRYFPSSFAGFLKIAGFNIIQAAVNRTEKRKGTEHDSRHFASISCIKECLLRSSTDQALAPLPAARRAACGMFHHMTPLRVHQL